MFYFCLSKQEMTTSLFGWNFVREELQRSPEGIHIADLFSFLISFALKKEEQESSLDFAIVHEQRKIIFSLSRGLKFVLCLLE
jgi:hypothetical protein